MKTLSLIHFALTCAEIELHKEIALGVKTFPSAVPRAPGDLHDLRHLTGCTETLLTHVAAVSYP